jgi:hypothetical protein
MWLRVFAPAMKPRRKQSVPPVRSISGGTPPADRGIPESGYGGYSGDYMLSLRLTECDPERTFIRGPL